MNPVDDSREGIERYLKRNPTTCFLAYTDADYGERIVGVILTGHDKRLAGQPLHPIHIDMGRHHSDSGEQIPRRAFNQHQAQHEEGKEDGYQDSSAMVVQEHERQGEQQHNQ